MNVRVMFAGRGYSAVAALPDALVLADGSSVDDALQTLTELGGAPPGSCLLAVSGTHLGTVASHLPLALRDGDELLLIAPVAGG